MRRTILTLAALIALSATPAVAGPIYEVAGEPTTDTKLVASEFMERGYGRLVTSQTDGGPVAAQGDPVTRVTYPDSERPMDGRGQ
jgi:hypothetical protein